MSGISIESEIQKVVHAANGSGPLFQRDYSATIEGSPMAPRDLAQYVRRHFVELAPPETAAFELAEGETEPLKVGDELKIRIGGVMPCGVRVVQVDDVTLTLRTLAGHPEAGRISFRAGRDEQSRLTFAIRSRARSGGLLHYVGFLLMGRTMQARCWIRFIGRVAQASRGRMVGPVRVRTAREPVGPHDCDGPDHSTFDCGSACDSGRGT